MKLSKGTSLILVLLAYIAAVLLPLMLAPALPYSSLLNTLILDLAATAIIFFISMLFNNSSIYDPYWSVIPPLILWYWLDRADITLSPALLLLSLSVLLWSFRLTSNWVRDWDGMTHEDWRYREFRERFGPWYWLTSFGGIHLFPTLIVFLGLVPVWYALPAATEKMNIFHLLGTLVASGGAILEFISDEQLRRFRKKKQSRDIIRDGLWQYSRHPNYLGEIMFWTGLWIFGIRSVPGYYWTVLAPLSMTAMFVFVSAPWMERRIMISRPEYQQYKEEVPQLLPLRINRKNRQ